MSQQQHPKGEAPATAAAPAHDYDRIWQDVYGDIQIHGPTHRHLKRVVRALLAKLDYRSVLDVGCGPGHNLEMLSEGRSLERVAGIDISQWALDQAAKHHRGGKFVRLDVTRESLPETWDLVHCGLVLEHVEDDVAMLANLRRMTGRHLLITTIAGDRERYRAWEELVGHVRNYRRGELEEKLRNAGFRITRSIYWGFPFYSPIQRTLQNLSPVRDAGTRSFSPLTRAATSLLYLLYHANSSARGDIVVVHAEVP